MEAQGIRAFVHKYHLGLQPYYYKLAHEKMLSKYNEATAKKDPSGFYLNAMELKKAVHSQRQAMMHNSFQMCLRVTMQLKQGSFGKIEGPGVQGQTTVDYTGNHIAVFECQLKAPPALTLIDNSYKEYVVSHRLNFKNWKLVDIDNYMNGNSFFNKYVSSQEWQSKVDKVVGPKDGILQGINNQHEMDQLKPLLEKYENYLSIKEPFSN
jgi:hypothetical protein